MKTVPKQARSKRVAKAAKPEKKIKTIPGNLMRLHFDDRAGWLAAYRACLDGPEFQMVARAMVAAFRRRFFLSQTEAGRKLGVSAGTINKWENGLAEIRWKSKREMLASGWFQPYHFGLDAEPGEFLEGAGV